MYGGRDFVYCLCGCVEVVDGEELDGVQEGYCLGS